MPRAAFKPLETAAVELAKAGRNDAFEELLKALGWLGLPSKDRDALLGKVRKDLEKARAVGSAARAIKALRDGVAAIAARLPEVAEPDRRRFAELLLSLDDSVAAAREVLGHELVDGSYLPPGGAAREAGRRELQRQLQAAMRLEIAIDVAESKLPLLTQPLGAPGWVASSHGMQLHTGMGPQKTERMLRQTLRAAAFVNVLRGGKLEVPDYGPQVAVVLPFDAQYRVAVDMLAKQYGEGSDDFAMARAVGQRVTTFSLLTPVHTVMALHAEADVQAWWLANLEYWRTDLPALQIGRLEYACRAIVGRPTPYWRTVAAHGAGSAGGTRASEPSTAAARERVLLLARAGVQGGRRWLQWLTERGEDPALAASMQPQMVTIGSDERLKSMLVVEFLFAEGKLGRFEEGRATGDAIDQERRLVAGLGESLGAFESRFDAALLAGRSGLLQRLQRPAADPGQVAVLTAVAKLRAAAGVAGAIELDDELGDGCRAHAEYLGKHREQTEAWPDAHEEYADRDGFSAAGSMAGLSSVITAGVQSDQAALDAWMGTFYHRLPLLDPGLRRIGYSRVADIAVLDAGSMVEPPSADAPKTVVWPYDGMRGVPIAFAGPELPNPVPGEDQSKFGYPITVQFPHTLGERPALVRMVLRKGGANGPEVPCWFSSPEQPTNPVLAPPSAACLIPKAPLEKGTSYHAEVEFLDAGTKVTWSFKT